MGIMELILWVLMALCWCKIFDKANIDGWKSFIPFYSDYVRFGIAGIKSLYIPFLILSVLYTGVNIVYTALSALNLADSLLENVDMGMDLQVFFWANLLLILFVRGLQIVMGILLVRKFEKSAWFGLGLALVPIVFVPILAFGNSKYDEENDKI